MLDVRRMYKMRGVYLALLPAALFLFAIIGYPLISAFWLSFHHKDLLRPGQGSSFIGLSNYIYYFKSLDFWRTIERTALWTSGSISLKLILGLCGALLLNGKFRGRGLFRSLLVPPWVVPLSIGAIIWSWLYNSQFGLINSILLRLGIIHKPFAIMGYPSTAFAGVLVNDAWTGIPFMALVFLGGLQAIPEELYEAARVDGANAWNSFVHITLPQLRNVAVIATLLSTIWTFNSFSIIWIHTRGGPVDATTTLVIDAYKATFQSFRFGRAATLSVLIFVILMAASYVYSRFIKLGEDR